ncbi:hypothetical protein PSTG_15662 [Puccinia striiformis f. sp. tritici PST-78]|uniref:RRM domain-containing protein n=1 Tax=Puccinia striiformis f. sp. tritici PST-78 TaxID=1165861 RepID=A0A0L0UV50_9BASI|nr:hypothetical protein PSTG_15654 [Puccinia striiformis f. sp. tritici PST-78]KNE90916.1 hypothetical protein PSTG_15662 [Puccinia striiformis f. sp. tritici PST-78]
MSRTSMVVEETHQVEHDSQTKAKRKRKSTKEKISTEDDVRDDTIDADQSVVSDTQITDERPKKKENKKKKIKSSEIVIEQTAAEETPSNSNYVQQEADDEGKDEGQEDEPEDKNQEEEIEAISHKERRKRRKLEKKKLEIEENEDISKPKPISTVTSSKKVDSIFTTTTRTKHGVWVGNMLFTTTPQELARFFEPAGTIVRLNMPTGKREHEANSGFAYVDFQDAEAVDAAVEKSECLLGGRKLLIKRATDYSGRPSAVPLLSSNPSTSAIPPTTVSKSVRKVLDRQKQPPAPCIYFGNLGFETTSEGIVSMLHAHHQAQQVWKPKNTTTASASSSLTKPKPSGKDSDDSEDEDNEEEEGGGKGKLDNRSAEVGIRKVRMGTFEDSGKCKGFAFVDFHTVEQATNVLVNMKNHRLDGRNLTVEYASAEAVKRGGGSARLIQHKRPHPTPSSSSFTSTTRRPVQERPTLTGSNRTSQSEPRPRVHHNTSSSSFSTTATIQSTEIPPRQRHPLPDPQQSLFGAPTKPKKEFLGRQKPGAALANAHRAPTGIVKNPETVGKKTVFS